VPLEPVGLSAQQQLAIIGHALQQPKLWDQIDVLGGGPEWAVDPGATSLWKRVVKFRTRFNRPPNATELADYVGQVEADPVEVASGRRVITEAVAAASGMGLDVLSDRLTDWAKARAAVVYGHAVRDAFNVGKLDEAFASFHKASDQLRLLEQVRGRVGDDFSTVKARLAAEKVSRLAQKDATLSYGISFMDDITGGIPQEDCVLIAAPPGVGKTQLATIIGGTNARAGKKVAMFALEARENEVESRLKFRHLMDHFIRDNPDATEGDVPYAAWWLRQNLRLDKYEDVVDEEMSRLYAGFRTYYRVKEDFTPARLEREILRLAGEVDLIILDHLHYVDLETEDENTEMNRLMKRIRQVFLGLRVPIILIAHLRKEDAGGAAGRSLVPRLSAIHGSSAIGKIATTAWSLASAPAWAATDPRAIGYGTFARLTKFRLQGSRMNSVGLLFYDAKRERYNEPYALGRLNWAETKWKPLAANWPIWAPEARLVKELSEV
jgi:energy-coupling factor transporter ATP-binding protein EcfA2